jgi:hypothetical protein
LPLTPADAQSPTVMPVFCMNDASLVLKPLNASTIPGLSDAATCILIERMALLSKVRFRIDFLFISSPELRVEVTYLKWFLLMRLIIIAVETKKREFNNVRKYDVEF